MLFVRFAAAVNVKSLASVTVAVNPVAIAVGQIVELNEPEYLPVEEGLLAPVNVP